MSFPKRHTFHLAASLSSGDPLIGEVLDSKYELVKVLDSGGVGKVYLANRLHIGDQVAIKVLNQDYANNDLYIKRFHREAFAAAKSCNARVVEIFDAGETSNGIAYLVMQLIKAPNLRDVLAREGKLTQERAVALMIEICGGMAAVHQHGITHRDLKPENIMVLPPDEGQGCETVKIVDFGYAKPLGLMEQPGMVVGTAAYMSPEQCRGDSLDVRSDVYSLGVILYQMLTGRPPFTGHLSQGIMTKHLTERPRALSDYLNVDPMLESVLMRALAKDPDDRYADAHELECALRAWTNSSPLSAYNHWQAVRDDLRKLCTHVFDAAILKICQIATALNANCSGWLRRHRGKGLRPLRNGGQITKADNDTRELLRA